MLRLFGYALTLCDCSKKSRPTFSANQMYFLRVLIGSLRCLPVFVGHSDSFGVVFMTLVVNRSKYNYSKEKGEEKNQVMIFPG